MSRLLLTKTACSLVLVVLTLGSAVGFVGCFGSTSENPSEVRASDDANKERITSIESGRQPERSSGNLDLAPSAVEQRLREDVRFLASDELSGRGIGTKGLDMAAEHIAKQFSGAGLRIDVVQGSAFQQFQYSAGSTMLLFEQSKRKSDDDSPILKNVIGVLAGQGLLAEETIVLGAHYDHLGMGGAGTLAPWTIEIHNGADDNASGVATLIEVARQLAAHPKRLRRRLLFIAFSAEESGLVGSEYYVSNPLVPLEQTIAMLNLDMVGRMRAEGLTIYGTGTARDFGPLVDRLGTKHGLRIQPSPSGYGPSDHASFYAREVPVLHFFTGLHEDYHRPSDDYERVNFVGARQITQFVVDMVINLANADNRPQGVSSGLFTTLQSARNRPADGIYLGVRVSPNANAIGLVVSGVTPRSPAELSGLRTGDIIQKLGDTMIRKVEQLRDAVRRFKPGDQAKMIIRRDNLDFEMNVQFLVN